MKNTFSQSTHELSRLSTYLSKSSFTLTKYSKHPSKTFSDTLLLYIISILPTLHSENTKTSNRMRTIRFIALYVGIQILTVLLAKTYAQFPLIDAVKSNSQFPLVDRISSNFITSFAEDPNGYIWIGTNHGLNRFNGSNYAIFYSRKDSTALNSDYVSNLLFDEENRLWMSNECGLCVWENKRFRHLASVGFNPIGRILNLDKNSLIITDRKGIAKVNKQTLKEETYFLKQGMSVISSITLSSEKEIWSANTQSQAHDIYILNKDLKLLQTIHCPLDASILGFVEDARKHMWVITDRRLICYDVSTKREITIPPAIVQLTQSHKIHFLLPYQRNCLLIGIQHKGMFCYNEQLQTITPVYAQQKLRHEQYVCFIDSKNGIWLSDQENEFLYYPQQSAYNNLACVLETLKDPFVKNLAIDQEGYLWMRSSKDIASFDTKSEQIVFHRSAQNTFGYIFIDSRNDLWLINNYFEVQQYSIRQGIPTLKHTTTFPGNVFSISEDKSGNIWVTLADRFAILSPEGGFVYKYAPEGISFSQLQTPSTSKDMFLFTLENGIYKFGEDKQFVPLDSVYLPNPNSILIDRDKNYWFGTYNAGVIFHNLKTKETKRFDTSNGLTDNNIKSVIEDRNGNIWFSTSTCITQYNRQNQTCTSIYDKGFSKGKLYAINCAAATSNGTLYFGGSGGITVVYPDKPIEEVLNIPMNFDAVLVNGNMRTDNNGMLSLNHRENMITFWYSSLNFEYGSSLNYAYKLEGFDKDWIDAGTNKRVAYSNLPAGNYTFKVKVRKLNGEWSKNELKMDVCIHPAPWATPWAIAAYWLLGVLLTGGLIAILVRWKVQQERLALAERQKEMNQERVDFVTNISHEFRTPLALIYAPLKELAHDNRLDNRDRRLVDTMQRNAERLLQLTRQIVDTNLSEREEKELHVSPGNPGAFVTSLADNFRFIAHQKDLTLDTHTEGADQGYFDSEKVEKIVCNLLSNAIKYTPEGGHIDVNVVTDAERMCIEVRDTGIGIPPEKQNEIFKRFKRLDTRSDIAGSGIGLHYAQQLAHLHKGSITYRPNVPQGSCFVLELPTAREAYRDNELAAEISFATATIPSVAASDDTGKEEKGNTLLIAEDNAEVRNYLQGLLAEDYNIMTASDGEEALECISLNAPDLIVSDVVMPHKDGYELCRTVKSSTDWGHIPVILLTAKNDTPSSIRGLDCGADAYVGKPFDPFYLKAAIENLLANRRRVQQIVKNLTSGSIPKEKAREAMLNEHDRLFLEDLHTRLDRHLDDEEFGIALLAKEMGMSYSSLYARIKSLTGQTPQNFLITYRMNTAMQLLRSGRYTVSEVCYKVGSSSLANFSRSFKRQFGIPPSEV